MIAHGDHIGARIKDRISLLRSDAQNAGVLPVDHGKVSPHPADQRPQVAGDHIHAAVRDHVAHGKNLKIHKMLLSPLLERYEGKRSGSSGLISIRRKSAGLPSGPGAGPRPLII